MPRRDEALDLPDDDDRPRRRRQPPPAKRSSPGLTLLLVGGVAGVGLLVLACCGGVLFLGSRRPADAGAGADRRAKWGETREVGSLRIGVRSAQLSGYSGRSPAGHLINSSSPGLVVVLGVETDDKTKEHTARGSADTARVRDALGNSLPYMRLKTEFGFTCDISGQLKPGYSYSVRSDEPLTDKLVFDRPVEAASELVLTLEARNYGGTGKLEFEIPADVWKPK